jgi:co-chaperonin GroES (HSP10)
MKMAGDKVLILPDWAKEERYGSIHLPAKRQRDLPNTGVVKHLSQNPTIEFKVGDRVIFDRHKQQLMLVDEQQMALVRVEHVMAVFV